MIASYSTNAVVLAQLVTAGATLGAVVLAWVQTFRRSKRTEATAATTLERVDQVHDLTNAQHDALVEKIDRVEAENEAAHRKVVSTLEEALTAAKASPAEGPA
jgi:hypothetical protein